MKSLTSSREKWMIEKREWERVRITNKQLINMQSTINNFSLNTSLFFSISRLHFFVPHLLCFALSSSFNCDGILRFLFISLSFLNSTKIVCYFTYIQHLLQSSSHWFQLISMKMGSITKNDSLFLVRFDFVLSSRYFSLS